MTRAALLHLTLLGVAVAVAAAPGGARAFQLEARGSDFRVTDSAQAMGQPNVGAVAPAIAYNPRRDEYMVVWLGPRPSGGYGIYGRRLAADGRRHGRVFRVSPPGGEGARVSAPHLAYNPRSNRYLVAWNVSQTSRTAGRTLGPTGRRGRMRPLPNMGPVGTFSSAWPSLDVDPSPTDGGWLMTWASGDGRVFAERLDGGGMRSGEAIPISAPGELGQSPATAVSSFGKEFLVTWKVGLHYFGTAIMGRSLEASGAPGSAPFELSEVEPEPVPGLEARLDQPAVAFQPQVRDYLAVWDDLRAKRLLGRPAGTGGSPQLNVGPMSPGSFPSLFHPPTFAAVPRTNGFVVAYPQRSLALGQVVGVGGPVGPPAQISMRAGATIRYGSLSIPAVAARTRRRGDMLAVWSGRRNSADGPDVYGHRLLARPR